MHKKDFDLLCIGEIIVDFLPEKSGLTIAESATFKKFPGGAPANTAAGAARLGLHTAFMGGIANDEFGLFLLNALKNQNIDVSQCQLIEDAQTALAFVSHDKNNERSFVFYREQSADLSFDPKNTDMSIFKKTRVMLVNSNLLRERRIFEFAKSGADIARAAGGKVFFDPNLRPNLWRHKEDMAGRVRQMIHHSDIVRLNKAEWTAINYTKSDFFNAGVKVLIITDDSRTIKLLTPDHTIFLTPRPRKVADTTGAGDGFNAGFIKGMFACSAEPPLQSNICALLFAEQVAGKVVEKLGAFCAMPHLSDIENPKK